MRMVLEHEGGYVNHPADPGGETKYGITKRSYPHVDIRNLTVAQATAIYRRDWWDRHQYGLLPHAVAEKVMDMSVNMGARRAHILLQRALNRLGAQLGLDGMLGPMTRAAIAGRDAERVREALRKEQAAFYERLIARRPHMAVFRRGWMRRAQA